MCFHSFIQFAFLSAALVSSEVLYSSHVKISASGPRPNKNSSLSKRSNLKHRGQILSNTAGSTFGLLVRPECRPRLPSLGVLSSWVLPMVDAVRHVQTPLTTKYCATCRYVPLHNASPSLPTPTQFKVIVVIPLLTLASTPREAAATFEIIAPPNASHLQKIDVVHTTRYETHHVQRLLPVYKTSDTRACLANKGVCVSRRNSIQYKTGGYEESIFFDYICIVGAQIRGGRRTGSSDTEGLVPYCIKPYGLNPSFALNAIAPFASKALQKGWVCWNKRYV